MTQLPEGTVCDAAAAERCCWEHLQLPVGLFHYREFSGVPGTEQKIVLDPPGFSLRKEQKLAGS